MTEQKKHVALLVGGLSSEREVSLKSGEEVEKAIKELGHKCTVIDVGRDVAEQLAKANPDVAFVALHGTYGEDGCIQGLLEIMDIPYTHSGVLSSAMAMDKQQTKLALKDSGVLFAEGEVLSAGDILSGKVYIEKPYVIKPVAEGSSVGVFIVFEDNDIPKEKDLEGLGDFLVERYIPGKELTCAVTDNHVFGVIEITTDTEFYNYKNKYTTGMSNHVYPAPIDENVYKQVQDITVKAHKALGCSGVSRSDFRYDIDGDGRLYFLEINTHPGLTPLSLVPELANHSGVSFTELVGYLIENAKCQK